MRSDSNTIENQLMQGMAEMNSLMLGEWAEVEDKSKPAEIIIKSPDLSIDDKDVQAQKITKPLTLSEYIGQTKNKNSILKTLKIIKSIKPINILLHGYPGCGKSTLAEIINNELDAHYIYTIPEQLKDIDKIKEVLNTIQSSDKLVVWCIDEIQNIDKKLINILLPVLQDRRLGNVNIKDFVLIGATTDYNRVYKKSEALVSRFQTRVVMDKYTVDELVQIQKFHQKKMNIDITIPDADYVKIAENSRGVPREALNLLLKRLVSDTVEEVLVDHKIIKEGLTEVDMRILDVLANQKKPMGSNFLSQKLGLLKEDYELVYESYLVEKGLVERTSRGREITDHGRAFLRSVSHV